MKAIADSGLIIAFLDRRDTHHAWARRVFPSHAPYAVCEVVLAEVSATLGASDPLISLLERGGLEVRFSLTPHLRRLRELTRKYADVGMDLADACVVCMAEQEASSVVWTVDRHDFQIYRMRRGQPVPCQFPD